MIVVEGQPRYPFNGHLALGSKGAGPELEAVHREDDRLAALDSYDVLDTPAEESFDRIARVTKTVFKAPIASISLIDGHRRWQKSCVGAPASEVPRESTFCTHAIVQDQPLIVPDALADPRFANNPFVVGKPYVRFYAGVPLRTSGGHNIGTLCVVDTTPREIGVAEMETLKDLGRIAMNEFELRRVARTDGLTGALSRRAFKEEARRQCALALRHHHDLSCVTLDLDHFKAINDSHGHSAGDTVLIRTVEVCLAHLRDTDSLGRMGGEEFAVLLPHTGRAAALQVAEKLRGEIEAMTVEIASRPIAVRASFGIASLDPSTRDIDTLLNKADAALYEAKRGGRNRCVASGQSPSKIGAQRRRVLKAGQITFNGRASVIDCTVRSLSDDGAGLDVSMSTGIPRRFDLLIKAEGLERPCRVLSQTERHLEVAFC